LPFLTSTSAGAPAGFPSPFVNSSATHSLMHHHLNQA
jgi:hypothetical protein